MTVRDAQTATASDSFGSRTALSVGGKTYEIYSLPALERRGFSGLSRLPYSLRVLLENLLRHEDGVSVTKADIEALAAWDPKNENPREIAFHPARVLLQDFTGVPAVVDLAAMRAAIAKMGGDPKRINPLEPVDLVIDHSVQVDAFGTTASLARNVQLEFDRNGERYVFLRWGQSALDNFRAVPPGAGICHQVNLEYLARTVTTRVRDGRTVAFPDTVVGTDSHTTMINGLSVLGWGVGGIEAEAAMLGQPTTMLVPDVIGVRLSGRLAPGATATDLVLTITEVLRKVGVVEKFVEFFGPGLADLTVADRATLANMAPEYGATCGFFPIDAETVAYLRFSGRPEADAALVEAYAKAQGTFWTKDSPEPHYTKVVEVDLGSIETSVAGPKRPQDRLVLSAVRPSWRSYLKRTLVELKGADPAALDTWEATAPSRSPAHGPGPVVEHQGQRFELDHGAVVIAAITSCTNTSNPSVMLAAGLVARSAVKRGLHARPWVKTSLAPGSQVVTDYLQKAGLLPYLEACGFHVVGYGCTTCIGNSGPLPDAIAQAIDTHKLAVASVLSGNRNFEGRVSPHVRANYLASPPLVVAYALAGHMDLDLTTEPLGTDPQGEPVYLRDLWPSAEEVEEVLRRTVSTDLFVKRYQTVFDGDASWQALPVPKGDLYAFDDSSTYVKHPPYFTDMAKVPAPVTDLVGAKVLAKLGDSVTTDHISPAGSIPKSGPAGKYLIAHGVEPRDFNSFGARRGNHEVMIRGTFANIRLRNELAPGTEGGVTRYLPTGETMSIYEASERYLADQTPLMVLAGREYGTGSSRDWAAKGTRLLGVKAVLATSFERIHRSNLVGMGVLPLVYKAGQGAKELGLTGEETFDVRGLAADLVPRKTLEVRAVRPSGEVVTFEVTCGLDTPQEVEYYRHGGILQYVLRKMLES